MSTITLPSYEQLIAYEPMSDEPNWKNVSGISHANSAYLVPQDASSDPFECARTCALAFSGKEVCILVPGTAFDTSGARHGRGGGWYDRFLSKLPRAWTRIGVCFPHQLSATSLTQKPWDESVDFLLIVSPEGPFLQKI